MQIFFITGGTEAEIAVYFHDSFLTEIRNRADKHYLLPIQEGLLIIFHEASENISEFILNCSDIKSLIPKNPLKSIVNLGNEGGTIQLSQEMHTKEHFKLFRPVATEQEGPQQQFDWTAAHC